MLLSQRIAKDPSFIQNTIPHKGGKDALADIRLKIIRSTKFIVGHELWNGNHSSNSLMQQIYGDTKYGRKETQTRETLYGTYCRMPFPSMFIENDTGAMLLEEVSDRVWRLYSIGHDGYLAAVHLKIDMSDGYNVSTTSHWHASEEEKRKALMHTYDAYNKQAREVVTLLMLCCMEVLLFLNVQNVPQHKYVPTKKENEVVPKPLQPLYTYRILDLFREKKVLTTLGEITREYCSERKDSSTKRTHVVRGHFKKRNTGLFWWSHFVRNNANRETHGAVEKDYRITTTELNDYSV